MGHEQWLSFVGGLMGDAGGLSVAGSLRAAQPAYYLPSSSIGWSGSWAIRCAGGLVGGLLGFSVCPMVGLPDG